MKHTNGKWFTRPCGSDIDIASKESATVTSMSLVIVPKTNPNQGADANLIASAPEMLELLEEIRGIAEKRDEVHPDNLDMLYRMLGDIGGLANRAIAKAEGE